MSKGAVAYITGPMSGRPGFNIPAFDQAKRWLEENTNLEVISPPDLDSPEHKQKCLNDVDGRTPPDGASWWDYLRRDLEVIGDRVDAMVLLPGWWQSDGARIEVRVALKLGLEFFAFNVGPVPGWKPEHLEPWSHDEVRDALKDSTGTPEDTISREQHTKMLAGIGLKGDGATPIRGLDEATLITAPGEVRVTNEKTGGQKGRKPQRFELLPFGALAKVAEVYDFGASKYEPHNWRKGYDWSLSFGALQRHLAAFWEREDNDPETGLPHVAHAAFHVLALVHFADSPEYRDLDDRPRTGA